MQALFDYTFAILNRVRNRRVWKIFSQAASRQWWPRERLLAFGDEQARLLAQHAFTNVPYYRDLAESIGLDPLRLRLPEDWERIPLLTKDTLCAEFARLTSSTKDAVKAVVNHSGGSTGKPVRFLSDLRLYDTMNAYLNLFFSWAGWTPGEMCLFLWGGQVHSGPANVRITIRSILSRRIILPVYTYDESLFSQWWQVLNRYKPTILYAYPSVLAAFARWLESQHVRPVGVKGVFCSAEIIFPGQRRHIEQIFRCKVYNQYGSRETPAVACECPEGNMHVFVDINRVEFLDGAGDRAPSKRIVVTPLNNYAQPLLRYDLNDLGSILKGDCPCGRGYPLMRMEVARKNDHLIAEDGKRVYPSFFTHLMDGKQWIHQFQFRQKALNELDIVPLPGDGVETKTKQLLKELLPPIRSMMGDRMELRIRCVSTIKPTPAGKHRYVINAMEADK